MITKYDTRPLSVLSTVGPGLIYLIFTWSDTLHLWQLLILASIPFVGWIYCHRRYRSIADTPTARIGSASQGYAELSGIGRPLEGAPVVSPHNGLRCLWYRVKTESRDSDGEWQTDFFDESDASFIIDDGSGECVVDPEHARVITRSSEVTHEGSSRTTQCLLIAGTRIHAIGYFVTHSAAVDRPAASIELREKLTEWKRTGEAKRFDLNNDGELSQQEWELARAAAKREVSKERREADAIPNVNTLIRPPDGRAFIITDIDSDKLASRYRLYAWICLALFFAILAGYAWLS